MVKSFFINARVPKMSSALKCNQYFVGLGFDMIIYGAQEAYLVIDEIHLSDTRVVFVDIGFTDDAQERQNFEKNIMVRREKEREIIVTSVLFIYKKIY